MMYENEFTSTSVKEARIGEAQMSLFRQVYVWMTMALAITGLTALVVATSPTLLSAIFGNKLLFWGLIIAEMVLVFGLSGAISRLSFTTATMMFILYSVINGATLSVIFLVFEPTAIAAAFFTTAGTFAVMSVYGYLTRRDLSAMGNLLFMALIGLIIASVVNLFWANSTLYWIITYAGVLIFVGLIAWDTQKIKQMLLQSGMEVNDSTKKIALMGSLMLYLDFINLFLYILRIFGGRKD